MSKIFSSGNPGNSISLSNHQVGGDTENHSFNKMIFKVAGHC